MHNLPNRETSCPGDSGGGLMVRDESGIWTLIGIVSTGSFIIHLYFYIIILIYDVSINKKGFVSTSYWCFYRLYNTVETIWYKSKGRCLKRPRLQMKLLNRIFISTSNQVLPSVGLLQWYTTTSAGSNTFFLRNMNVAKNQYIDRNMNESCCANDKCKTC